GRIIAWHGLRAGRPFFKTSLFVDASVPRRIAPVSYQGVREKWKGLGMGDIPGPRAGPTEAINILGAGQPNRSVAADDRPVAELIVQADAHDMIVQVGGGAGEGVGEEDALGAGLEGACDRYPLELGIQVFRSHA